MPRTPSEAGLLEIKLKRKLEFNNFHKKEFVDLKKIFTALNFLKKNNHPSYLFFDAINDYEKRFKEDDPVGHNLIFVYQDGIEKIVDIDEYLTKMKSNPKLLTSSIISQIENENPDPEEQEEIDCLKNDPTRKFQFNYDKSVCMVDKFPKAAVRDGPAKK